VSAQWQQAAILAAGRFVVVPLHVGHGSDSLSGKLSSLPLPAITGRRITNQEHSAMSLEDPQAFRDRLRETGQMDAFQALKKQYIADGMTKKDAWQKAAAEFPPAGDSGLETPPAREPISVHLKQFKGKTSTLKNDIGWVYTHLRVEDVTPDMAPSSGAWGLLAWARRPENTSRFMSMAQKHLADMSKELGHPIGNNPFSHNSLTTAVSYIMHCKAIEQAEQGILPEQSGLTPVLLAPHEQEIIQYHREEMAKSIEKSESRTTTNSYGR
jgi:hypothetical protein